MAEPLPDHISKNIDGVVEAARRERESTTSSQRRFEKLSRLVGRPGYLITLLLLVLLWAAINLALMHEHIAPPDPPPFGWMEGFLTLVGLLTTTVVLIGQNRQGRLEQQRAHLDLQINLLTEQKVTKVIHLIEELRRDLPMVRDRHDPNLAHLQQHADTAQLISAIEEVGLTKEGELEVANKDEEQRAGAQEASD